MKAKVYALYKGDNLLITGTIFQIAKARGIKIESVYFLKRPSYLKRCDRDGKQSTRRLRLIEIEAD